MDADLVALAEAHGVATSFENSQRKRQDVPEATVVAVLGLLGVDASSAEAVRSALAEVREPGLPGTVVLRTGATYRLPGPATITL